MKIGSLAECIKNIGTPLELNKIYTVLAIHDNPIFKNILGGTTICDRVGILLVEIRNNSVFHLTNEEKSYNINRFREVFPPIENIEEHINENTLEPALI